MVSVTLTIVYIGGDNRMCSLFSGFRHLDLHEVTPRGKQLKRLVVDLDGTITVDDPKKDYSEKEPNLELIAKLRDYAQAGFEIVIQTARNMRTYENSVGKITAHTLPVVIDWLRLHNVPYDEIHVAKPWCGTDGFYVDDRSIRPDEFINLSLEEIHCLLGPGSGQ